MKASRGGWDKKITRQQLTEAEKGRRMEEDGGFRGRLGVRSEHRKRDRLVYIYKPAEGHSGELRALGSCAGRSKDVKRTQKRVNLIKYLCYRCYMHLFSVFVIHQLIVPSLFITGSAC